MTKSQRNQQIAPTALTLYFALRYPNQHLSLSRKEWSILYQRLLTLATGFLEYGSINGLSGTMHEEEVVFQWNGKMCQHQGFKKENYHASYWLQSSQ
jgi:hypothetical protein